MLSTLCDVQELLKLADLVVFSFTFPRPPVVALSTLVDVEKYWEMAERPAEIA